MDNALQILSRVLSEDLDASKAEELLEAELEASLAPTGILPFIRTVRAYREQKWVDFCGHLRQCLCYASSSVAINGFVKEKIEPLKKAFGFIIAKEQGVDKVNISPVMLQDIPDLSSRYRFKSLRRNDSSLGDGSLYRNFKYKNYLSLSQKFLIYSIRNMSENETLLACLPTGGGKSLSWELPALEGTLSGTVIVVVPTIALACDHEKSSRKAFENHLGVSGEPVAYYSSLTTKKKQDILNQLENGAVPILYISPEALLNKQFKNAVTRSAKNGYISMLVVDEAHLIAQWGLKFRPEFQLIAAFRDSLEEVSHHGIKTVLLSATLNRVDTDTIKTVFYSKNFSEYRADALRTEPEFYLHRCENERMELVKRLIYQVPRPVIIYAATVQQAKDTCSEMKSIGFKNVEVFTGETSKDDRESIMNAWDENRVDIICATSAFGMGVSKPDVRTIITIYIPENISRFYQEVGRSGRDGYASLSYWLYQKDDWNIVRDLTKAAVPTIALIAERWTSLLKKSTAVSGNARWLDLRTAPDRLKDTFTGEKNLNWNKDIVLFLLRRGLISILDCDISGESGGTYKLLVRLNNISLLENEQLITETLSQYRDEERGAVDQDCENVSYLLKNYKHSCLSEHFTEEFPYSASACSGCPSCRSEGNIHFSGTTYLNYYRAKRPDSFSFKSINDDLLSSYLDYRSNILIAVPSDDEYSKADLVAALVKIGANIIVLPPNVDKDALLERTKKVRKSNYMLLTFDELAQLDIGWIFGVCALFYSDDDRYNSKLFSFAEEYLASFPGNKVINIAPEDTMINTQSKTIMQLVDAVVPISTIE